MDPVTYILDTNVIADRIRRHPRVIARLTEAGEAGHILGLCDPVRYEVSRGLHKVYAARKLQFFRDEISPLMKHLALSTDDWQEPARLWAAMRNQGRQFSDVDLLIASLAQRLDATVVTADADFASLPVKSEDWR
ncbi:MAG: PIN domain-containing protein [Chloroflexi bacterium]|nr:PIN domain-containing protein [Chloroflexota bacterium]